MPEPTVGQYFLQLFWIVGEVGFKWVPGALAAVVQPSDQNLPPATLPLFTQPVSVPQVAEYFQVMAQPDIAASMLHWWSWYVAWSILVSLLFGTLLVNSLMRLWRLRREEHDLYEGHPHTIAEESIPKTRLRWNRITELASSESEQDWRVAILSADQMLSELLDTRGYKGDTMADKLRAVDKAHFHTIDLAWEAHRYRNEIAHESLNHHLSHREILRHIGLFEKVFQEFGFVE